jgi:nitrilase
MVAVVAAVQATPVFLDRDATVEKAVGLIKDAAAGGAALAVFGEAFVPAYPDWVWRTPPWADHGLTRLLREQAVEVPGPSTQRLGEAAAAAGIHVVVGVNEIAGGTLYNTLLFFGPDGALVHRHRKLMPTGGERVVWGFGDGSTLDVVPTPFGNVGGLICWENYMPLARAAMYGRGVDVYLAPTWDTSDVWVPTLRHIAKEGGVYVVGVAQLLRGSDVPEHLNHGLYQGAGDWMSRGLSTIVAPGGELLAGPVVEREEIIYAEVDQAQARAQRRLLDPVGHYARPDVLRLTVDTAPRRPVTFTAEGDADGGRGPSG